MKRRALSVILALTMMISFVVPVFAESGASIGMEENSPAVTDGTGLQRDSGFSVEPVGDLERYVSYGDSVTLQVAVTAGDMEGITYQWYQGVYHDDGSYYGWYDEEPIDGADADTFAVESVTQYAEYVCQVTDSYGSKESIRFIVHVGSGLTAEPVGSHEKYVTYGENVTLQVRAEADILDSVTYQWYSNRSTGLRDVSVDIIPGATTDTYVVENVTEDAVYYCKVADPYGEIRGVWFRVYAWEPGESVDIDEFNFPDESFRVFVEEWYDKNKDGVLNTAESSAVTEIACDYCGITSLRGLEYFTALTSLYCNTNDLTELDVSANTELRYLCCINNQLTRLDISACPYLVDAYLHGNREYEGSAILYELEEGTALWVDDNVEIIAAQAPVLAITAQPEDFIGPIDSMASFTITAAGDGLTYQWQYRSLKDGKWYNAKVDGYDTPTMRIQVTENRNGMQFRCKVADCSGAMVISDPATLYVYTEEGVAIDEINFPDGDFRSLVGQYDTDGSGTLSEAEIAAVTSIQCCEMSLTSLRGVEHFTALEWLDCGLNELTELDVSANTALTYLRCADNHLSELDVSANTALTKLICSGNALTELDLNANRELTHLACNVNPMTELDISSCPHLVDAYCNGTRTDAHTWSVYVLNDYYLRVDTSDQIITEQAPVLVITSQPQDFTGPIDTIASFTVEVVGEGLTYQWQYKSLKDGKWYNIKTTGCHTPTMLISISTARNGMQFRCKVADAYGNSETSASATLRVTEGLAIDEINFPDESFHTYVAENCDTDGSGTLSEEEIAAVTELYCDELGIRSFVGLEHFTALTHLYCFANGLTELDVSANTALTYLKCTGNQLETLDISNCPHLVDAYLNGDKNDLGYGIRYTRGEYCLEAGTDVEIITGEAPALTITAQPQDFTGPEGDIASFTVEAAGRDLIYQWQYRSLKDGRWYNTKTTGYNTPTMLIGVTSARNGMAFRCKVTDAYGQTETSDSATLRVAEGVAIDEINFPDEDFRSLVGQYDTDGSGTLSEEEIAAVTIIQCSERSFASLRGVEYFTALERLDCDGNQLTELDVSGNKALTELSCANNQLTSLNVRANTALAWLSCSSNQLTELDVSGNTALRYLYCYGNQLTELDVSGNTALIYLFCYGNQLTELDISNCPNLADAYLNGYRDDLDYCVRYTEGEYCLEVGADVQIITREAPVLAIISQPEDFTGPEGAMASFTVGAVGEGLTYQWQYRSLKDGKWYNAKTAGYDTATMSIQINTKRDGMAFRCKVADASGETVTSDAAVLRMEAEGVSVDEANFPDEHFRAFVAENCDRNGDGILSEIEIAAVTEMYCSYKEIESLQGVEYFTALENLQCYGNILAALDVSGVMTLTKLCCSDNQLTELNVTGCAALTILQCQDNRLTALDVSGNTVLGTLQCQNNQLTALDLSANTALRRLDCYGNALTALDLSANTELKHLSCHGNALTALDVSANGSLEYLTCSNNGMAELSLGRNAGMKQLYCAGNSLETLDIRGCTLLLDVYRSGEVSDYESSVCYRDGEYLLSVDKSVEIVDGQMSVLVITSQPQDFTGPLGTMAHFTVKAAGDGLMYQWQYKSLKNGKWYNTQIDGYNTDTMRIEVTESRNGMAFRCKVTDQYGTTVTSNSATLHIGEPEGVAINETNFPDENFRSLVAERFDTDGDGYLSEAEIAAVTEIDCCCFDISSLEGVQSFTALEILYCDSNMLTALDVSGNPALMRLSCASNQLTTLDISACPNLIDAYYNGTRDENPNTITYQLNGYTLKVDADVQIITGQQAEGVAVDETNFPDENFRAYVAENCDTDGDGYLSDAEVAAVKRMDCSGCEISSLEGVQNFTALETLYCDNNMLTALDVSGCTALTVLNCECNDLPTLPLSDCQSLRELHCGSNLMTDLDLSGCTALEVLYCGANEIPALDVSGCGELKELYCDNNRLTALDLSGNEALEVLDCQSNQITALDLSANELLTSVECASNRLATLDVSANTALTELICCYNPMTALDVSGCAALTYLWCSDSQLADLDLSGCPNLERLICRSNPLVTLDISYCAHIVDAYFNGTRSEYQNEVRYILYASNYYLVVDKIAQIITGQQAEGVAIDETNFPDESFRAYVTENCDADGDGYLSEAEIAAVKRMDCCEMQIEFLQGIEYFAALEYLYCGNNCLTTLDVSGCTALTDLNCENNQLTELDVSGCPALFDLMCGANQLTTLDLSGHTMLMNAHCEDNQLTELNVTDCTTLWGLYCDWNQLVTLDLSGCPALYDVACTCNHLTELNVSGCPALTDLNCSNNELETLDVSGCAELAHLWCSDNRLTALDVSGCPALRGLDCDSNQLTTLDISTCPNLIDVYYNGTRNEYSGTITYQLSDCTLRVDTDVQITTGQQEEGVTIDEANFPDANFRAYVAENCDADGDGYLSEAEIAAVTEIDCRDFNISSLEGVQSFTALETLYCGDNQLTALDVSGCAALRSLDCNFNQLTMLDLSGCTALTELDCDSNQLTTLDISNCPNLCSAYLYGTKDVDGECTLYSYSADGLYSHFSIDNTVQVITEQE